jgi:hypothetical protein
MTGQSRSPWWPAALGTPSTFGSSESLRYAFFPVASRLALQRNGIVLLYDTGPYQFRGALQENGPDGDLSFVSQLGRVSLSTLKLLDTANQWVGPFEEAESSAA